MLAFLCNFDGFLIFAQHEMSVPKSIIEKASPRIARAATHSVVAFRHALLQPAKEDETKAKIGKGLREIWI